MLSSKELKVSPPTEQKRDSNSSLYGYEAITYKKLLANFEAKKDRDFKQKTQDHKIRKIVKKWKYASINSYYNQFEFILGWAEIISNNPDKWLQKLANRKDFSTLSSRREVCDGAQDFFKLKIIVDSSVKFQVADDGSVKTSVEETSNIDKVVREYKLRFAKKLILVGADFYDHSCYTTHYINLLKYMSQEDQIKLAKIDMAYHGVAVLKKYNFPEGIHNSLRQQASILVKKAFTYIPPELIEECVKQGDREGLYYLIYQRFSGELAFDKYCGLSEIRNLFTLFHANADLGDIAKLLPAAMQAQEAYWAEKGWVKFSKGMKPRQTREDASERLREIKISHGGGFFHAHEFVCGRSDGYPLQPSTYRALGLQVSPNPPPDENKYFVGREEWYARKENIQWHFDLPARFFANLRGFYLDAADRNYEAGLRAENIDMLKNPVIKKI